MFRLAHEMVSLSLNYILRYTNRKSYQNADKQYVVLVEKKSAEPRKVTRSKVWIAGHTHANGRPARPEFADTIVRIIILVD